ncbi:MAG: tRNA 2-thiouridine(34) synthase MnmA [Firmicutes bacterium]|nr:tRNA 2-thiouridine(34) synthase MnmA [Bacillota bacterium]
MKKVVIGISGGVDSAAAAIILKEQGYEVIGITLKFTDEFDEADAIEVCKKLNIEHHILDYRDVFKEKVIDRFINDYNNGLTPNPCIICNRYVKLNFLYENMINFNADYFATGHYAKVIDGKLYKSSDVNKDQTYFLANMTKEHLNKIILPLEGLTKEEVRNIANKYNLSNATKKDSTDVCFITTNFKEYMKNKINSTPGDVINVIDGKIIGKHEGLNYYTIGQRRGLNIGGTTERMYVVGKDINKNILYIATGEDNDYLVSTSCIVENINIFNEEEISNCKAKFRYRQEENNVVVKRLDNNTLEVIYGNGIKSVTPGQACVFYKDNECLGCGIIKEIFKEGEKLWYLR